MTCWFFMSYARADDLKRDEHLILSFYDDLKAEVAARVTDQSQPIAFLDQADLKIGELWPVEIARALCTCRTLVPVMTARYFTREYCGKEWAVFESRLRSLAGPTTAPLIIPILWIQPEEERLPEFATDIQITFDSSVVQQAELRNLEDYGRYGLQHIAKRKDTTHRNIYETILEQLAARIIHVAKSHSLPELAYSALPSIKDATNRFAETQGADPGMTTPSACANFAIVAANASKMGGLRENADLFYGLSSEHQWMPYAPNQSESVGLIAQAVATERKLIVNWISVGPELLHMLEDAESNKSAAIMIVDPWVVRRPEYRDILRQFDKVQFLNCVVLIPWNKSDPRTQAEYQNLLNELRAVLSRSFALRNETFFRSKIEDPSKFREALTGALSDLEALLAPSRQPVRKTGLSDLKRPPYLQT